MRMSARFVIVFIVTLLAVWRSPAQTGTNAVPDASISEVRSALNSFGTVILTFNGTAAIAASNSPLVISHNTVLEATGLATISGNNISQVFQVASNITFIVSNLTIIGGNNVGISGSVGTTGANGANSGANGGNGGNGLGGGNALGGALVNNGSTTLENCIVSNNIATGGAGGTGGGGGNGGSDGTGGNGGGGGNGGNGFGGAIYNLGVLLLTNSTFANNTANGGNGGSGGTNGTGVGISYSGGGGTGGFGNGAGIYNLGTATIANCTFSQNTARSQNSLPAGGPPQKGNGNGLAGANGPNSMGGGICNLGTETIVNSTFDGNTVAAGNGAGGGPGSSDGGNGGNGGNGGSAIGGGIYNAGSTGVTNCTFANGAATGGTGGAAGSGPSGKGGANGAGSGGNIATASGTFILKNSILASPAGGACASGAITDFGNNISSDVTPAFSTTNSHSNLDPLLGGLDNNGGPTLTMPLLIGSPAIDAIFDSSAPAFDQRGFVRPFGSLSDIGAFEYGSSTSLFLVSGHVTLGAMAFPGVTIQAGNSFVVSSSNGGYSFLLASNGNYTVTPQPLNYFFPASTNLTLSGNITNLNFMATNAATLITNNTTNHTIQFTFSAVPTFTYRIQAATNFSTNLPSTNWVDIATNTVPNNSNTIVVVVPSTNFSQRFFRTVTP
jgi:hypothetical protein